MSGSFFVRLVFGLVRVVGYRTAIGAGGTVVGRVRHLRHPLRDLTVRLSSTATSILTVTFALTFLVLGTAAKVSAEPGDLGELSRQLAEAEARLRELNVQVEVKLEDANKARVDLRRAERGAVAARSAVRAAAADAEAALKEIAWHQRRLDELAANSYQHGTLIINPLSGAGTPSPREYLLRSELLEALSQSELTALDDLRRAWAHHANAESLARRTQRNAVEKQRAAEHSHALAEAAQQAAADAQTAQADLTRRLVADREAARARVANAQRGRPFDVPPEPDEPVASNDTADSGDVETVVARALSQVGIQYAWGGGDASGPTVGVRDGGVADEHGDYGKVGFDCSGLMLYAFAGVGIELDHYSGYQYAAGRKIPLSQIRRGDMLFWQEGENTHHVALYLGDGMMIEAPYSGSKVRVTPVRYAGIAPHAVRLL